MKCQACDQPATRHVTEIVAGKPAEYHVCEAHLEGLEELEPRRKPGPGPGEFLADPALAEPLHDLAARQKLAAYLLPPLCLALLDTRPEVRIVTAFRLLRLGPDARSAAGALRDALHDADPRVRKAAAIALRYIEDDRGVAWSI